MVAPKKEGFGKDDIPESSDRQDRPVGGDSPDESRGTDASALSRGRIPIGLTERLRDVPRDEANGDLLLDRSDIENGIMQWLGALDLQVLGACRADERLKPLLKLNILTGVAEDGLMAQLNQHFEASEVGMLARCLCVPLVSIRVGKVNKQGNLLCPTAARGRLNLTLLPSSNMRISFAGDDSFTERLAVLSNNFESEVVIEEITADSSGRSFLLKLPRSELLYFWCSEKSKLHGMELLAKMKDLLKRKPMLSQLTGICESRLDSFATHLRAYLVGSSNTMDADPVASSGELQTSLNASDSDLLSPSMVSMSSRCHITASHTVKGQPSHQGILSPRPNTFKDGSPRSPSSMRSGIREKLRQSGDNSRSSLLSNNQLTKPASTLCSQSTDECKDNIIRGINGCGLLPFITQPEMPSLSSALSSSIPLLLNLPPSQISPSKSFSPYYCWCPPCPSSLQYSVTPSHLPTTYDIDESMPLPPVSSLLSVARPPISLVTSNLLLDVPKLPTFNLPSLLPEPFVCLPHPVTSLVTLPTMHVSTFTPFMSDPIVHIPVIDVCSGQGYLVSAGPAISSPIPSLLPTFVNCPLIANTESAVEKGARETLRMLMASTPAATFQKSMNVLPGVLNRMDENFLDAPLLTSFSALSKGINHSAVATGCQGPYRASLDVEAVAMGLSSSRSKVDDGGSVGRGKLERDKYGSVVDPALHFPDSERYDCTNDDSKD